MAPILYMLPASPPVRSVLMVAKLLNVELELKECNILAGEQHKEEFLKLNPAHTIPTLVDDGFALWESTAIMGYLVDKYGNDDSLYPKDNKKRALIDQLLHFSTSSFTRLAIILKPIMLDGKNKSYLNEQKVAVDDLFHNLDIIEIILENKDYLAGENLTIADFSYITWISTVNTTMKMGEDRFPRITSWWRRLEKHPCYEIEKEGSAVWAARWAAKE